MSELIEKAAKAKAAASQLSSKTTLQKNEALKTIADQLTNEMAYILRENEKDIDAAKEKGIGQSLIDRLMLNEGRIVEMAEALIQLTALPDPIGDTLESWERPNGLAIQKVRVPLGVVGMIYEARPNVTVDASSLCLKTGNAVLLRGSSSALHSNQALVNVIHRALEGTELPADAVQLLEDVSRETASDMFRLNDYLDVLIPRGGKRLIQTVVQNASVPVLETGAGNCHIFIDQSAKPGMAAEITVNAKTQRPSVCNAAEKLIVHEAWAKRHLAELAVKLRDHHVELRGDERATAFVPDLIPADGDDWETEYLDKILAIKVVANVHEAVRHINRYGTKHSEAILTESEESVSAFFQTVDAAVLYHNASTRFTDGFEFGFGAEIGISTQKLHARGPMGLPALTSTKYTVCGEGQIKGV
ncbi:glutamate-5-semialdehyde dehydrogenase [Scopulibacillus darangshiensis]|uniref:Gamma-glutamyl phosphate reductase n=1 Tax=Scopulibacillus darangshiensis TaxID=442528 RepID=A0A4R2P6H0_9BACL|nr:glutamate-5-semialdehyde dehydrogenase [Scopulibacillus darangshiensis]TCP29581.1 glutamate-5-semialdehyde dehydrogenase [Scopulibacillus darangshiensis]